MRPMSSTYSTWYSIICAKASPKRIAPQKLPHPRLSRNNRPAPAAAPPNTPKPPTAVAAPKPPGPGCCCCWAFVFGFAGREIVVKENGWLSRGSCNAVEGVYICDVPQLSTSPCTQHKITVLPLRCQVSIHLSQIVELPNWTIGPSIICKQTKVSSNNWLTCTAQPCCTLHCGGFTSESVTCSCQDTWAQSEVKLQAAALARSPLLPNVHGSYMLSQGGQY